ncbi:uncharacterized protein GGS25DRAFT_510473 [Hypoxylon fragiforme]|uniref:uncharacterized protein n=1 Tax=Hypoxylon fragiforme TaxID=63214 RepID=UPI0020C66353|nr:uncharacterized protein GGS25DRAFT_510473 [Hypoxylon fragiforme]KAI2603231.1 hypothetical protein GGS25DRAFT_510473 [Hypoxylon fragiforme]
MFVKFEKAGSSQNHYSKTSRFKQQSLSNIQVPQTLTLKLANMLPIISLLGISHSGKAALGRQLSGVYNLYYLDLEEMLRKKCELPFKRAGIDCTKWAEKGEPVPNEVIREQKIGYVSVAEVQIFNCRLRGEPVPVYVILQALLETVEEVSGDKDRGGRAYNAILLHGFSQALQDFHYMRNHFAEFHVFPKLAILIECPVDVAMTRFINRTSDNEDAAAFGKKLEGQRKDLGDLIPVLEPSRLVRSTNDGSMAFDKAFEELVARLNRNVLWKSIVGAKALGETSSPSAVDAQST